MKRNVLIGCLSLLLGIGAVAIPSSAGNAAGHVKSPGIEGTYQLVMRELPDGSKQRPPDVQGLMTFTKKDRNFNVYWKDASGKSFSIASVSTYTLTEKEYRETNVYFMVNDEIGGKGVTYDLSGMSAASPVTVKGGRIEFQLPLFGEPHVAFERNGFTATRKGAFLDHWEKVE